MTFEAFGFDPRLMQGIRDMGYREPTPVQVEAIPVIMSGKDVIANAQTGTGKTAAFLLPILHRLISEPGDETKALVLVPTRELAIQVDEHTLGLAYHTSVRAAAVYGGVPLEPQERSLLAGTPIVAATPGRLMDLHRYGAWRFEKLKILVLDEADRMLDMGFLPDIQWILSRLPPVEQTLLFSATMPQGIVELARRILKDPVRIRVGLMAPPAQIRQVFYCVPGQAKPGLLARLFRENHMHSVLVFVRTRTGAERLYRFLRKERFSAGVIHGNREQRERDDAMMDFKNEHIQILVATDIAARGLDIEGISHIVNFDIPEDPDAYIHRIGRTARAGAGGDAFTFYEPEEEKRVREIESVLGRPVERVRWGGSDRPPPRRRR